MHNCWGQAFHAEPNGWIEGTAILAAVAIVTLVTAANDYSKETQFRQLSELADAGEVCLGQSTSDRARAEALLLRDACGS